MCYRLVKRANGLTQERNISLWKRHRACQGQDGQDLTRSMAREWWGVGGEEIIQALERMIC